MAICHSPFSPVSSCCWTDPSHLNTVTVTFWTGVSPTSSTPLRLASMNTLPPRMQSGLSLGVVGSSSQSHPHAAWDRPSTTVTTAKATLRRAPALPRDPS